MSWADVVAVLAGWIGAVIAGASTLAVGIYLVRVWRKSRPPGTVHIRIEIGGHMTDLGDVRPEEVSGKLKAAVDLEQAKSSTVPAEQI
jgi:hypothetical protein